MFDDDIPNLIGQKRNNTTDSGETSENGHKNNENLNFASNGESKQTEEKYHTTTQMTHQKLNEILDFLQDGYVRMDPIQIVGLFCEDAEWWSHPHDPDRMHSGVEEIVDMLNDKFEPLHSIKFQYDHRNNLLDTKRGIANVQWIVHSKLSLGDGRYSERTTSHSILMKFENQMIKHLRDHFVKTNGGWIRQDASNNKEEKAARRVNKHRSDKNGRQSRTPNTSSRSLEARNESFHRNTQNQGYHNNRNGRRGRYRNQGHSSNRYRNYRNDRRNGRHRGKNGRGGKTRGKGWLPWVCSKCGNQNSEKKTFCTKCDKRFKFAKDLTPEQRQSYLETQE